MTPSQVVKHFGSVSAAARGLGLTRTAVQNWKRWGFVPKRSQRLIELETGGALKASKRNGK